MALALSVAPLSAHEINRQRAEHAQQASAQEGAAEAEASVDASNATDERDRHTANPEGAESGPLGLSADWWIAIFTGVLTIATIVLGVATIMLWLEAKFAREDAKRTFKLLERPYTLDSPHFMPWVWFRLRNHGRTQAYITHIEMDLIHDTMDGDLSRVTPTTNHSPYKSILSQGEMTENMHAEIQTPFSWGDCDAVAAENHRLRLFGFFKYEDSSGEEYGEIVVWRWNPTVKRLVQVWQRDK